MKILELAGSHCERLLESKAHDIPVKDVQCDEIWGFVVCKEKRNHSCDPACGDAYCLVAFERHSKFVLAWHLGKRSARDTMALTERVNEATRGKFQITTDGFVPYFDAIHTSLGVRVDYARLIKVYEGSGEEEHRYSPPKVVEEIIKPMWGKPDPERICTSHVERHNLTMRMQMRRLTRLTNGFSKKWENLGLALALYFAWYNFCKIHSTIRCSPAMESGLTDHVWTLKELLSTITQQ